MDYLNAQKQVEATKRERQSCYSNLHANCPDSLNGTEVKRFQNMSVKGIFTNDSANITTKIHSAN